MRDVFGMRRLSAAHSKSETKAKSCILIWLDGGPSHLETFDLKPQAPAEVRGPFQPISTSLPGVQICELMPRLARMSEQYAVIRSMTHKMAQHDKANSMLLAGRENTAAADP
ncbi:MAG: DUF1501 domain-containing protein [Planctomycetes bacterium]|nr:DUF1501 domain-containing protein [Planctomycetota bacterium]